MKKLFKNKYNKGFTLIEILLVVAAISILAGIVILAINPNKQLGDTRNAQRRADVTTILNGVYQYFVDKGTLPPGITTNLQEICVAGVATTTCTTAGLTTLNELVWGEKYTTSIPLDPQATTTNGTGYRILRSVNNRITVMTMAAEQGATISVTR